MLGHSSLSKAQKVLHERLLLPNLGRDDTVLYAYILEYHINLLQPDMIVFLYGHGAISWHSSCESIFGRATYLCCKLAGREPSNVTSVIMALTDKSSEKSTFNYKMSASERHFNRRAFLSVWTMLFVVLESET